MTESKSKSKPESHDFAKAVAQIRAEIGLIAGDYHRAPANIRIMAVSKTIDQQRIEASIKSGQRLFGENRVQEAAQKFPALRAIYSDIELHLIGPLQSNKLKQAFQLFDMIETIDRPKLVEELVKLRDEYRHCPRLMIQVNSGREPQKSGVWPENLADLVTLMKSHDLPLCGLMCVPPQHEMPTPHFIWLAKQAELYQLTELSMGMSGDYPYAVACGSTLIRLGSKLFGERPKLSFNPQAQNAP